MPPGAKHPQPGRASEAMPDPPPLAPFIRLGKIPQKYKRRRFPICAPPPSPQPPQPPRPQGVPPQPLERLQLSAYRLQRISRFAASILRLCRAPSPRGCMLGLFAFYQDHLSGSSFISLPLTEDQPLCGIHPIRHPTTADAVPLPSKEGRSTTYKKAALPNLCAATFPSATSATSRSVTPQPLITRKKIPQSYDWGIRH